MNTLPINKPVKLTGTFADLTDPQRQQLIEWLNSTQTYEETKDLVEKEFKIQFKGVGPLRQFWKQVCVPRLQSVYCPPLIPREVWETSIAEMVKVLKDPKTEIEIRLRVSALLLQIGRLTMIQNKVFEKTRATKISKTKPVDDNPDSLENADIEDIRRLLFGPPKNKTETMSAAPVTETK
jgi:hypothetical protein